MDGVRRICRDDSGNDIPCMSGGDPPEPEDKPYRAQIHLYQPNRLKDRTPQPYDLHWQMGWFHNNSYSSSKYNSLARPLEEGFVTRYSKGENYYMKLWYDDNEDQKFDRNTDSWFAKFKLVRTKQRCKFNISDLPARQFINKIERSIHLDFEFPNEHFLDKHKQSDKYLFARTDEQKELLFKTVKKWEGYNGVGLKKAFIFPKYLWKEIYGKIGMGFRTNGSNSRRQLAKDLTTYPVGLQVMTLKWR